METYEKKPLQVVVGIIQNPQEQYLISRRHDHQVLGGYWEFPGGKQEYFETPFEALCRELFEEIDIVVQSAQELFTVTQEYNQGLVLLNVWRVLDYIGEAKSKELQPLRWISREQFGDFTFPPANEKIIAQL